MGKLALRRRKKGWQAQHSRRIWQTIAAYANADLAAWSNENTRTFRELVHLCADLTGDATFPMADFARGDFSRFHDVNQLAQSTKQSPEWAFREILTVYQDDFRRLLTWLCSPEKHSELAKGATQFLMKLSSSIRWTVEANTEFDEVNGCPLFYLKNISNYGSILSPVCKFIFDRIERFHEGDPIDRGEAVPLIICQREGCGRFALPQRKGRREFCGNNCRSSAYQSKQPRTEKNRYQRKYRATVKKGAALPKARSNCPKR